MQYTDRVIKFSRELAQKFDRLVSPILGESRCDELMQRIWNFNKEQHADVLIGLCQKDM